jgi:oxygen-independent coproporphyrinogen-3 oxidase
MVEGIKINEFKIRFNIDIYEVYGNVIERNIKRELLICKAEKLFLSERGMEISNYVMSDFILS